MSKGASHAPGKFRGRRPALEEPPISVTGRERDGCRAGQFLDRRTAPCSRALPPNPQVREPVHEKRQHRPWPVASLPFGRILEKHLLDF